MTTPIPEPDILSPQHVKKRLQEIIEALKENRDIDVPETEIRELQHFFNERSMVFLQSVRHELRQRDAARRLQGPEVTGLAIPARCVNKQDKRGLGV